MTALGDRIRQRRQELGLTQDELSKKSGISKGFLCDLENGKRGVSATNLLEVARALGQPVEYLMTGGGSQAPSTAEVQIPAGLSSFAREEGLTFSQVLTLLEMRHQIVAHRSSTKNDAGDDFDWRRFYASVKEYLS